MTDSKIESLTSKLKKLNIDDHLSNRMPPRSSFASNYNKRSIEDIAEKPGIIRKNHISETKKQKFATGKRKKYTKKRKHKKRKSIRKK